MICKFRQFIQITPVFFEKTNKKTAAKTRNLVSGIFCHSPSHSLAGRASSTPWSCLRGRFSRAASRSGYSFASNVVNSAIVFPPGTVFSPLSTVSGTR